MGEQNCQLLGGVFSVLVQLSLAAICILTLVYKRHTEVPQRDWFVWFLDATKQGIGSGVGHFSNMFVSVVIANSIVGADECQWYCLTYVIDCTFGTVLNLTFLSLFEKLVQHYQFATDYLNFGEYGNPPSLKVYALQLSIWLLFVVLGKCIILFILIQVINPLDKAISVIFSVFQNHPQAELVTVMIIIPSILNSIQFWVTDTFLKKPDDPMSPISPGGKSSNKYKHNRLSLSDSDTDLDEDLMSNNCNLGGSPVVNQGYKSLNISKSKHTETSHRSQASSSHRKADGAKKSSAGVASSGGSSSGGSSGSAGSGTSYNQYISDPTKLLSDSTKQYVIPSASYVAKMYKKGTANMPNLWSYFGGGGGESNSAVGVGSRHSSKDSMISGEDNDDSDGGRSPVAHNPLIHSTMKSNAVSSSSSGGATSGGGAVKSVPAATAVYKKNDSFSPSKDALLDGHVKSVPGSGVKTSREGSVSGNSRGSPALSVGSSASGQLKQRKDFVGDVESNTYL